MQPSRAMSLTAIALGIGVAVSAILGPLVLDVIQFRVSAGAENQLLGGEIVSLLIVAPLAIAAGVLWGRGDRLAPILALGPAVYAVYTYVQFIIGPDYGRYEGNNEYAFPLYLALIILGWAVALGAWTTLGRLDLPAPTDRLRRSLAGVLIVIGVAFALTWAGSIAAVLGGESAPQEYLADPTLFWLIRLMDLGFIIPAALITAVGLLRGARWATRLAYAVTGFLTLEVGAVAAMAAALQVRGDPTANPVLLVGMVVFTLALATAYLKLLYHARPAPKRRAPEPANRRRQRSRA